MKRKSISKKLRFDVFKRDSFVCQYCGATPPAAILEIDHINPVAKGGQNQIDNLLTACLECNRGKSDGLLTTIPEALKTKAERLDEHEEQIRAFNKLLANKRRRENKSIGEIEEIFQEIHENREFTKTFKESVRQQFLPYIPTHEMVSAMSIAATKTNTPGAAIKYFCGICWNKRRQTEK